MPPDHPSASIYEAHRKALVDYADGIVRDRSHAEDVVQDAWLRLNQAERETLVKEPVRYLYRIVRNLAIDSRRSLSRLRAKTIDLKAEAIEAVADEKPNAETDAIARDELSLVLAALDELPERTRMAIEMHRFEGKRLAEIAAHLGLSVSRTHTLIVEGLHHCMQRRNPD